MPPFLTVMGFFYILVAVPFLISFVKDGYWNGVIIEIADILKHNLIAVILCILIVIGLISKIDLPFTLLLKNLDRITHDYTFWDFISSCAEGGFVGGILFSLFMLGNYLRLTKFSEVTKISLMSSIYGGLANGILKFIFNRERPVVGFDPWHFFAFFGSGAKQWENLWYAYNSMPSGHAVTTLAAVTPYIVAYKNKLARSLLILWALMINFARVYTINHWLSDVTIASMLGIIIGIAVYRVNQWRVIDEK